MEARSTRAAIFTTPSERTVVITRTLDAPRDLVWKAWTEPKHMARWWGPKTFTNPVCDMDVRPGGAWCIVMRSPDGVDYPLKGIYREVTAPGRLVMNMDLSEHPDAWHDLVDPNRDKSKGRPSLDPLCAVTFEEAGGKTKLTIRMSFESVVLREAMVKMGMEQGWNQSLNRLAELLVLPKA
jgi:uncharacterized protein YndB with AHSA1/START domain